MTYRPGGCIQARCGAFAMPARRFHRGAASNLDYDPE